MELIQAESGRYYPSEGNMNDQLRTLIIGSSLVLAACDPGDEIDLEQDEQAEASSEEEFRTLDGLDPDCVDVNAPIIVRIDPSLTTCEFTGFANFDANWDAASLFEDGSPMLQGLSDPLPLSSPLRTFCRYDYTGTRAAQHTNYAHFLGHLKGGNSPSGVDGPSAATDCPVIYPMTDEGLDTAHGRAALHKAFMASVNAISDNDLENVPRFHTELVLLDTVAEGETPQNEHGLLLEKLAADVACPGDPQSCMSRIRHVLVTPRVPDNDYAIADWTGGSVGYMHEFSMGLAFALRDWAETNLDRDEQYRRRLVVSAAIGADPRHPLASDPDYAPAQSAIVALQAAYCMGAAVYAAAGNTRDNSCPNTEEYMLAPARYEGLTVPTIAECSTWGYVPDKLNHTYADGTPLIHAVGGLDGDDPIANHRRLAHPRLAATAANAISSDGTVAITGTSVGTVVAAATHHLWWSLEPEATGAAVSGEIYTTGNSVLRFADDGLFVGQKIRRLSVCHAVSSLLGGLDCKSGELDPDNLDEYVEAVEDAIDFADQFDNLIVGANTLEGNEPDCSEDPTFDTFIRPQPDRPDCAYCNIKSDAVGNKTLNMSIENHSWTVNLDVVGATLYTYNVTGPTTTFDLAAVVNDINNANPANVIQVSIGTGSPASAVLEFEYSDGYTSTKQSNPIPLL